MRVAIYARVSTMQQFEHNYSIDAQLADCRRKAHELKATVIDEYIDAGLSGTSLSRPEMQRLLKNIESGRKIYDALIVYKLDRLARNNGDLIYILNIIMRKHNIKLIFPDTGQYSNNAQDFLFLQFMGAFAEFDNEQRRERSLRGKIEKRKQGQIGFISKFGYNYSYDKNNLEINGPEAKIVQKIFDLFVNDGLGCERIAKQLNIDQVEKNTPKSSEFKWYKAFVLKIIKDESYTGTMYTMKYKYTRAQRKFSKAKRDESQWIPIKIPQIINKETWDKAQQILISNKKKHVRSTKKTWILQGLVYCNKCKNKMYIYNARSKTKTATEYKVNTYFKCKTKILKSEKRSDVDCSSRLFFVHQLEDLIWNTLVEQFSSKEKLKKFINLNKFNQNDGTTNDLKNLINKRNLLKKNKSKLIEWVALGDIDSSDIEDKLKIISTKLKKITEEIEKIKADNELSEQQLSVDELYRKFNNIKNPDRETKKDIISSIIERIYVERTDDRQGRYAEADLLVNIVLK